MVEGLHESYVRAAARFSRITPEREVELSRTVITGRRHIDIDRAVNELVESNLLLVIHCLEEFTPYLDSPATGMTRMDLVAEGNIGLLNAARNYDACRGLPRRARTRPRKPSVRFSTYACRSIKNAMRRAVKLSRFIHIPEHHFSYWSRLPAAAGPEGRAPSTAEVSRQLGVGEAKLQMLRRSRETTAVHLEDLSDPERGKHWSESVADTSARAPARETESRDLREFLDREISTLPERTQRMLRMAHFSDDPQPFSVLAKTFGVSKERCRQVCRQGLSAMRRRIEGRMRSVLGIDSAAAFDSAGERRAAEVVYRLICNPEPAPAFTSEIETSAA